MFARTQPGAFKRQVQRSFDATTSSYGTPGDFHWDFAQRLVERAPVQPGQTLLDVATGSAPAAILAAQHVGLHGHIIASDLSLGMIRLAQQHLAATGYGNVSLVAGDAEALPVRTSSMDGILCSSAIVWFPNIPRVLGEWYRIVRPGGWIAFSCFGGLASQMVNELVIDLLAPYGITYPELTAPLNTPHKCRAVVAATGFEQTTVQTARHQQFATDSDASFAQAWGLACRFNVTLPPAAMDAIRAQYRVRFQALLHDQDRWNHDYEQFVVAYKPRRCSGRCAAQEREKSNSAVR